jgi:hypothetical protein
MKFQQRNINGLGRPSSLLIALAVAAQINGALGLQISICSSQNTGSGNAAGKFVQIKQLTCANPFLQKLQYINRSETVKQNA